MREVLISLKKEKLNKIDYKKNIKELGCKFVEVNGLKKMARVRFAVLGKIYK